MKDNDPNNSFTVDSLDNEQDREKYFSQLCIHLRTAITHISGTYPSILENLRIEFFLPLYLLTERIHSWKLEWAFGQKRVLGKKYHVSVRAYDRYTDPALILDMKRKYRTTLDEITWVDIHPDTDVELEGFFLGVSNSLGKAAWYDLAAVIASGTPYALWATSDEQPFSLKTLFREPGIQPTLPLSPEILLSWSHQRRNTVGCPVCDFLILMYETPNLYPPDQTVHRATSADATRLPS